MKETEEISSQMQRIQETEVRKRPIRAVCHLGGRGREGGVRIRRGSFKTKQVKYVAPKFVMPSQNKNGTIFLSGVENKLTRRHGLQVSC